MAGFQRRSWGGAKPSSQNTTTQNNTNDKWNLTIKSAKYSKNGDLGFKLGGFKNEDLSAINQVAPDIFFVKQSLDKTNWLWVKNGKFDEFIADVEPLENFLRSTDHYQETSIAKFGEKIEHYAESTPTEEEIASNDKQIASNWKELLSAISDPEIRKKFLAFQTTYTCVSQFKDASLSPANVISVLAADPNATFVTDKNTWESKFLRRVLPNSPFVIITKAENNLPPLNLLRQDPEVQAAGGWNQLVAKSGGPWFGAAWAAIKRVRLKHNLKTTYYKTKVYDVRYTEPFDSSKDPFMTIPNLINNLTGEINAAARAILDQEYREKGLEPQDYNAKKEGLETDKDLAKFKNFILAKCKKLQINVSENGTDADIVANAVFSYAYAKAESLNKLQPKVKTAFANAVCYAIAVTFNIESPKVASCANFFQNISQEEAESIAMDSFETYKTLANFSIVESIGDHHILSFDEFSDLIVSKAKNKSNIKNNFDNMMSRMESVNK